jgi:hypothetical protein
VNEHLLVATSKYNIASAKEIQYLQGVIEETVGARRLFLECEQIYAKVLGADHEETLDAAMRAQTVGRMKRERKEIKENEEGEQGDSDCAQQ